LIQEVLHKSDKECNECNSISRRKRRRNVVHTTINIRICLTNMPCGKKDGSLIDCIDFRALNKVTRKDAIS
jgi:hypothetical protein